MEKWKKRYQTVTPITLIITCVVAFIFVYNESKFSSNIAGIIKTIICLILLLTVLIFSVICVITVMKRGIHNLKKCDDELFSNIDKHKKCWEKDRQYYIEQIQIINFYYQKGGKVDELVNNREIGRLYARADFLLTQISLYDNLVTYFLSLVLSVIASFICQMMKCKNVLLMFVWMIAIIFSFFGIVLFRYAERGQGGSYRYQVDEYEKDLLLQKVKKLEEKLTITAKDEQVLETKQIVINELIRIRKEKKIKKQKEKVEYDIKQVEQLDLCIGDYSECYIQKIYISGAACCLVYDREKGKENNYIGERNLINQEYAILYQILNKYELISYCGT